MMNPVMSYPDDGPLAAGLRKLDARIGFAEQVVLVALLVGVVFMASSSALAEKFAHTSLYGTFKDDAVRAGTFALALLGAAFATHQGRHLAMDLISKRLQPRSRLVLNVILALFTIGTVALLIRAGFDTIAGEKQLPDQNKLLDSVRVAYLIPIAGVLIIVHTAIHMVIDIDYIRRRVTPPEKMRTGH